MKNGKILIIDDNEDVLFALNLLLEPYVEQIKVTTQPERIEHFMSTFVPDVILLDMNFRRDAISGQEGFFWLEKIKAADPDAVVLFITAYADTDKPGRMEVASGGTLFLDEIGNLSLPMQAKLLTAIEKRQILRLGATRSVPIDVRLISATNMDIHAMVQEGTFRQDLLYRINTIELHIPPLRERGNDILLLADYFLDCYARKYKKKIGGLTRDAKTKLQSYAWPGNVRELQHAIERAVILSDGPMLRPENFMLHPAPAQKKGEPEELNLGVLEKEAIERALRRADGNITRAAELLGITRFALYRKLDKLGL